MWIAFKNYYLRDTTQHTDTIIPYHTRCELLSKIIIFVTRHNGAYARRWAKPVVNCFQKLLSSWHDTTWPTTNGTPGPLWIAFKNYYLRDTTQPWINSHLPAVCCELLSKIIIFVTRHNCTYTLRKPFPVVNCFQKLLSSWHDTTMFLFTCLQIFVVNCFQKLLSSWHDTT